MRETYGRLAALILVGALTMTGCASADNQFAADIDAGLPDEIQIEAEQSQTIEGPTPPPRDLGVVYSKWASVYPQRSKVFDTEWPTEFTRRDLVDTALAAAFEYFSRYESPHLDEGIEVIFQPEVPAEHREWIKRSAKITVGVFRDYTQADLTLFVGLDGQWLMSAAAEKDVALPGGVMRGDSRRVTFRQCCVAATEGDSGWVFRDMAWVGFSESIRNGRLRTDPILNTVGHELFHLLHGKIDGSNAHSWDFLDPDVPAIGPNRPFWMVEGSASFFAAAINDYADIYSYYDTVWEPHAAGWFRSPTPGLENYVNGWDGVSDFSATAWPAWMDMKAIEYIVANKGVPAYLDIFVKMSEGLSFEEAFSEAIGLSVAEFYLLFDLAYENMMRDFLRQ